MKNKHFASTLLASVMAFTLVFTGGGTSLVNADENVNVPTISEEPTETTSIQSDTEPTDTPDSLETSNELEVTETPDILETPDVSTTTEETVTYPSFTYDNTIDGYTIHLTAPEGSFEQGTQLSVTKVDSQEVLSAIQSQNNTVTNSDIVAFDFDFYKDETHNIQPLQPVSISISKFDQNVSLYHLEDETTATQVASTVTSEGDLTFDASAFSIYAVVSEPVSESDGQIWINDNTDTKYATLNEAVDQATAGSTIHMQGNFTSDATNYTVNKAITIEITGNTTVTGSGSGNAFSLNGDAKLTAVDGATLSISNVETAFALGNATLQNGHYVVDSVKWAVRNGKVQSQTNDRSALVIEGTNILGHGLESGQINGATIRLKQSTSYPNNGMWYYPSFTNSTIVMDGFYSENNSNSSVSLNNSDFTSITRPDDSYALILQHSLSMSNNSTLTLKGGRLNLVYAGVDVKDSTINIFDSIGGGFNITRNAGNITITNSTINARNMSSYALFGTPGGLFRPYYQNTMTLNNVVINTDAKDPEIDGGGVARNSGAKFFVNGGSYKMLDSKSYTTGPTNGIDKENPSSAKYPLRIVTLNKEKYDNETSINLISNDKTPYKYDISRKSDDGLKHIYAPAVTLTFKLNNSTASFENGENQDKSILAIRGLTTSDIASFDGKAYNLVPIDAAGRTFKGWYYMDGEEKKEFTSDTVVYENTVLTAEWEGKASIPIVSYHINDGVNNSKIYQNVTIDENNQFTPASYEEMVSKEAKYNREGYNFVGWATTPDGEPLKEGEKGTYNPEAENDLYAKWEKKEYTVKFSANGGVFNEDSIFKTDTDHFEIELDENGGEVAVAKTKVKFNEYLRGIGINVSGINSKSNFTPIASKEYYQNVESYKEDWWGTTYYYWKSSPDSALYADIRSYTRVTKDVTYYLNWELADNVHPNDPTSFDVVENTKVVIGGDEYTSDENQSIKVFPGQVVTTTLNLDLAGFKNKVKDIYDVYENDGEGTSDAIQMKELKDYFEVLYRFDSVEYVDLDTLDLNTITWKNGAESKLFEIDHSEKTAVGFKVYLRLRKADQKLIEKYPTFASFYNAVKEESDNVALEVKLPISKDIEPNKSITMHGDVNGKIEMLVAKARVASSRRVRSAEDELVEHYTFNFNGTNTLTLTSTDVIPLTLDGDIEINGDTQNKYVYPIKKGEKLDFTGVLDISKIQEQIDHVKNSYENTDTDEQLKAITTSVESTFTATINFDEGYVLPSEDELTVEFTENPLFEVVSKKIEGQSVIVEMKLKNPSPKSFYDLYNKVMNVSQDKKLRVKVGPITVSDSVNKGDLLVARGTVTGIFNGVASRGGENQYFNFTWDAKQSTEGKDVTDTSDSRPITFTSVVVEPENLELNGDLLLDTDSQDKATPAVALNSDLKYVARLTIEPIKDKMKSIVAKYGLQENQYGSVQLFKVNSSFVATFTFDEEYDVTKIKAELTKNDLFEIDGEPRVDGNVVTLNMKLVKELDNFKELYDAVNGVDNQLFVTLTKVKITKDKMVQLVGTLEGSFDGIAMYGGRQENFSFNWKAIQDPEFGRDVELQNDLTTISIHTKIKKNSNNPGVDPKPSPDPVNPTPTPSVDLDLPSTPDDPNQPLNPSTPSIQPSIIPSKTPHTGVNNPLISYIFIGGIACLVLVGLVVLKKKNSK